MKLSLKMRPKKLMIIYCTCFRLDTVFSRVELTIKINIITQNQLTEIAIYIVHVNIPLKISD